MPKNISWNNYLKDQDYSATFELQSTICYNFEGSFFRQYPLHK